MKKLLCLVLLVPQLAFGQECTRAYEVTSPCHGVLLPKSAADSALACLTVDLPEAQTRAAKAAELCTADKTRLSSDVEAYKAEASKLKGMLDKCTAPIPVVEKQWYENQWLWFSVGMVAGAGLVLGSAVAVR